MDPGGSVDVLERAVRPLGHAELSRASFLVAGEVLAPGRQLEAPSGAFSARMRGDGNLVVVRNADRDEIWCSGTAGHRDAFVLVEDAGEVVICSAAESERLWCSGTGGNPGSFVQLYDDGRLVVHDFYRNPLWSSNHI